MEKETISAAVLTALLKIMATLPAIADDLGDLVDPKQGRAEYEEMEKALSVTLLEGKGNLSLAAKLHILADFACVMLSAEKLPPLDAETAAALANARKRISPPVLPILSSVSAKCAVNQDPWADAKRLMAEYRRRWIAADLLAADIALKPLFERLGTKCGPMSGLLAADEANGSNSAALKRVSCAAMNLAAAESFLEFGGVERMAAEPVGAAYALLIDLRRFLNWRAPDGIAKELRPEIDKRVAQGPNDALARVALAKALLDESRELAKLEK